MAKFTAVGSEELFKRMGDQIVLIGTVLHGKGGPWPVADENGTSRYFIKGLSAAEITNRIGPNNELELLSPSGKTVTSTLPGSYGRVLIVAEIAPGTALALAKSLEPNQASNTYVVAEQYPISMHLTANLLTGPADPTSPAMGGGATASGGGATASGGGATASATNRATASATSRAGRPGGPAGSDVLTGPNNTRAVANPNPPPYLRLVQ